MARITLDSVHFRYPGTAEDTLAGLQLDIANGEAHALLGASGAGKTTLLNLLSGLLTPTSGQLLFDDKDVSAVGGRERNVAQVFQFPVLYDSLSVADNLAFPLRARGQSASESAERIAYICEELDIAALRHKRPGELSLFEKQLVAVGKALVRDDVTMVLLDEPLTAVEPRVKWRLRQTLRKVQRETGVTMIYVTHDQTEALTFADRVSILSAGRIVQTGTPADVYESPATEFVGHFVGSPGMNFLPTAALTTDLGDRLGFRPEWASLGPDGPVAGTVSAVRLEGTRLGEPFGLFTVQTEFGAVAVRGANRLAVGDSTAIRIHQFVSFAGGVRVADEQV